MSRGQTGMSADSTSTDGNEGDVNDDMIGHAQLWRVFRNISAQIYPAFGNMNTFKRCWDGFCQGMQQEPRSTFFHLFVAGFGVLPLFGFIMFITGAFLLTCVTGLIAFWVMFFSGLLVFATLTFFILVSSVWLSWIMSGALTVWMEWPYVNGGVCTIRRKVINKLVELGFIDNRQADGDSHHRYHGNNHHGHGINGGSFRDDDCGNDNNNR